jgi:hypothetical protein
VDRKEGLYVSTPSNSNNTVDIRDVISQMSGYGTMSASFAELLSGFNHRSVGAPVPIHAEGSGITFFTRPNLNLSYDNLAIVRALTPLLTGNSLTLQRVIRSMLDPVGSGLNLFNSQGRNINTPLFDTKCAFMPLLTNNLLSLTGWPDIALDTYTSHEGILRENWSMVDGNSNTYTATDLNATFRNVGGDPITLLLFVWATYMDHIHRGTMTPYLQSILTNRIDYQTRVFRFTLDPARKYIMKWCSATGCFPVNVPTGAAMNFSADNTYTQDNAESIAVTFRAQIIEYFDPIHFNEFNETVEMFNPNMSDDLRASYYTKVPFQYLQLFNYQGYPRVNVLTNELEWWVDSTLYSNRMSNFNSLSANPTALIAASTASAPIMASNVTSSTASAATPYAVGSAYGYGALLNDLNSLAATAPVNSTDTGSNSNTDTSSTS